MKQGSTFVIGDIHGNMKALDQVLSRSKFDCNIDRLITIGDYSDGYPDTVDVVETLIDLQSKCNNENIYLLGNHDEWTLELLTNHADLLLREDATTISYRWSHAWNQGGRNTYLSYVHKKPNLDKHIEFFSKLKLYHIDGNIALVHGGWDLNLDNSYPGIMGSAQMNPKELIWDREVWKRAIHLQHLIDKGYPVREDTKKLGGYELVYIGHTATSYDFPNQYPVKCCNVINIDSGAGSPGGRLLMLDITNNIPYISDLSEELYTNFIPRS